MNRITDRLPAVLPSSPENPSVGGYRFIYLFSNGPWSSLKRCMGHISWRFSGALLAKLTRHTGLIRESVPKEDGPNPSQRERRDGDSPMSVC